MCNKISYDSKKDALLDAMLIKASLKTRRERDAPKGGKLRPYECHFCDKWHLTSQPKRKY